MTYTGSNWENDTYRVFTGPLNLGWNIGSVNTPNSDIIYFGGGEAETIIKDYNLGWVSDVENYDNLNDLISKIKLSDLNLNVKKRILETAIKSYTLTTTAIAKVEDFEALKAFKKNGTSINQWSKSDIEKWRSVSTEILAQYKEKDDFTKRLIESKQNFKKEYVNYYDKK